MRKLVIPAQAGIQCCDLDFRLRGNDGTSGQRAIHLKETAVFMTSGQSTTAERTEARGIGPESLNLPNLITGSRLILAFVLFGMISSGGWWLTSAALFVFAASTDALDGYIARRYGQITVLGRILDPFVDKMIVCGAFIFLMGSPGGSELRRHRVDGHRDHRS